MLFEQQIPQDKGLFTFYREQAQREEQLKRLRRERKKKKQLEIQLANKQQSLKQEESYKKVQLNKHYLLPKTKPHSQDIINKVKQRQYVPKQRLMESIVYMGKDIEAQTNSIAQKLQSITQRVRQPSHILKSRRYRQKIQQLIHSNENEGKEALSIDQMHIQSLHKRNQSEQLNLGRIKQAIHSIRGSVVQLPEIRKSEQIKVPFRPKKNLKSQLIQQALLSRDRDKIKHIRNYLKVQSPFIESNDIRISDEEFQIDEKSFQVFEFRQQKLLGILKRFRKGI